jgi:hypothetical protein
VQVCKTIQPVFQLDAKAGRPAEKTLISGDRMMNRSINSPAAQMEAFWIAPFSDSMKRLPLTTIDLRGLGPGG